MKNQTEKDGTRNRNRGDGTRVSRDYVVPKAVPARATGCLLYINIWVDVKIMTPFWVP